MMIIIITNIHQLRIKNNYYEKRINYIPIYFVTKLW